MPPLKTPSRDHVAGANHAIGQAAKECGPYGEEQEAGADHAGRGGPDLSTVAGDEPGERPRGRRESTPLPRRRPARHSPPRSAADPRRRANASATVRPIRPPPAWPWTPGHRGGQGARTKGRPPWRSRRLPASKAECGVVLPCGLARRVRGDFGGRTAVMIEPVAPAIASE